MIKTLVDGDFKLKLNTGKNLVWLSSDPTCSQDISPQEMIFLLKEMIIKLESLP